jgi:hypothetical protein
MKPRRVAAAVGIAAVLSGSMLLTSVGASAAPHAKAAAATCNSLQQLLGLCKVTPTPTPTPTPTTASPTPTPTPTTSPAGDCSGETLTKPDGTPWVCTFDDEFNGTTYDASKWLPQLTNGSNFSTGVAPYRVCYVNNPNTISVSGGYLHLSVVKTAAKSSCKTSALSSFSTQYQGGELTTYHLFSQEYGRFEVRAKLPQSAAKGLQETFWLWPNNDTLYGGGEPASGEIDFAEFYSL